MKTFNYNDRIHSLLKSNSKLNCQEIGVLLMIDSLYAELPADLMEFRSIYTHINPEIINSTIDQVSFIKIAHSSKSAATLKKHLNHYVNVKFNDIKNFKTYDQNMVIFKKYAKFASAVIEEILEVAAFPEELATVFREKEEVKKCDDIYRLLTIYKRNRDKRLRFEILRKLILIVLIARINRCMDIEGVDETIKQVLETFTKGLGATDKTEKSYYLWLDAANRVVFNDSVQRARLLYNAEIKKRQKLALDVYPLQTCQCYSFKTSSGNQIIHLKHRNKFIRNGHLSYTSFIEKLFRKNLEFPNQVHDTIGIKMIVESENKIPRVINDLEMFLGGSSTRKREKNTYHRFDIRKLGDYASRDYFVWKAVYDIALPHPSFEQVQRMISVTKSNKTTQTGLSRLRYYIKNPQDFVIEVQLQDLKSYLLSVAKGSPTEHALLKMRQIRSNSFYKFFPHEIYEADVADLKLKILKGKNKKS